MNDARMHGVTGVPFVVINGKWAISGAQTADVYYQVRFPRRFPRRSLTPRRAADLPEARALLQDRRVQHRRGAREEDHADRGRADVRQADVQHGRDRVCVGLRMSAAAPFPCPALPAPGCCPSGQGIRNHAPRMKVFPACCSFPPARYMPSSPLLSRSVPIYPTMRCCTDSCAVMIPTLPSMDVVLIDFAAPELQCVKPSEIFRGWSLQPAQVLRQQCLAARSASKFKDTRTSSGRFRVWCLGQRCVADCETSFDADS
jgi:hypothetical protein